MLNERGATCVHTEPGGDGGAQMPRGRRAVQALSSASSSWIYLEVPVLHVWII